MLWENKKNWLVLGAGKSGLAAAQWLYAQKQKVIIVDTGKTTVADEVWQIAKNMDAKLILTAVPEKIDIRDIDALVLSPGVSPEHSLVVRARQEGKAIYSEIDLALYDYPGTLIAVTGTNGKSTVCAMCEHVLQSAGYNARAVGNIGTAATQARLAHPEDKIWVIELSSYQIETSQLPIKAKVAVFTHFAPDHLERHKTIKNYFLAKWKLFTQLNHDAHIILGERVHTYALEFDAPPLTNPHRVKIISSPDPCVTHLRKSFFKHDQVNATMALEAVSTVTGITKKQLAVYLETFEPLAHRLHALGQLNQRTIYSDSKSTNLDSCICALQAMPNPVFLFLGGQAKGEDFKPLQHYCDKIKMIWAFGAAANRIKQDLGLFYPIKTFETLNELLCFIENNPQSITEDVLFSPACASFDEFKDFAQRGDFFDQRIRQLMS